MAGSKKVTLTDGTTVTPFEFDADYTESDVVTLIQSVYQRTPLSVNIDGTQVLLRKLYGKAQDGNPTPYIVTFKDKTDKKDKVYRTLFLQVLNISCEVADKVVYEFYKQYKIQRYIKWTRSCRVVYGIRKSDRLPVAIKVFVPSSYKDTSQALQQAWHEANILQLLGGRHHIISLLDFMEFHAINSAVLVTPFYASSPSQISLSTGTIRCSVKMLLEAIQYMHSRELVHMDVNPSNLLYDAKSKKLWVIDVGLSCEVTECAKEARGTLPYMAPEVIAGQQSTIGKPLDVWSIGVVFGEWLFGVQLFSGKTETEIYDQAVVFRSLGIHQLIDNFPARRSFLTDDAITLLLWMLTSDPNARPTTTEALCHAYFDDDKENRFPQEKYTTKLGACK